MRLLPCRTETGGLLRLAVGLMQPFSEDRRDYTPLLNQLALYFQIRDDLINLASAEYMKAKSYCEDLTVRCWRCRRYELEVAVFFKSYNKFIVRQVLCCRLVTLASRRRSRITHANSCSISPPNTVHRLSPDLPNFPPLFPLLCSRNVPKEGKFSFPIIHCVRARPNDHRLLNILRQRTDDVEVKKHAVSWVQQSVSLMA